jgi:uncharacterized protein YndB with AHSA1/START domain
MGLHWAEHSEEIQGSPHDCFDAIVDYETFPGWQNAVEEAEILKRNRKKIGELVRFKVDGKVRKIEYVLRYDYDAPKHITWDFMEGNGVKDIQGSYTFEHTGKGTTLATYRLGVDPGRGVPGPVAKRMNKQVMKRSVEDLRDEVERRNAQSEEKTSVLGALRPSKGRRETKAEEPMYVEEETGYYRQVKPGEYAPDDPAVRRGEPPPSPDWGSGPMDRVAKPVMNLVGGAFGVAGSVAGRLGRMIPGVGGKKDEDRPAERRD